MIATLLLPPPLLVAQRLDRVEACRLACRVVAEEVPTAAEKANPPRMAVGEIGVGKSATAEIVSDTPMPQRIPAAPPIRLRNTASARNCRSTCRRPVQAFSRVVGPLAILSGIPLLLK
jgi:hypothetical protein